MAGLIRVTPEELRAMAKQYGVESQEVLNQVDRLNRMISDLKKHVGRCFKRSVRRSIRAAQTFIYQNVRFASRCESAA